MSIHKLLPKPMLSTFIQFYGFIIYRHKPFMTMYINTDFKVKQTLVYMTALPLYDFAQVMKAFRICFHFCEKEGRNIVLTSQDCYEDSKSYIHKSAWHIVGAQTTSPLPFTSPSLEKESYLTCLCISNRVYERVGAQTAINLKTMYTV